jgi:hypothetical protein
MAVILHSNVAECSLRLAEFEAAHKARSHCRFVLPFTRFIRYSLTYSVPLFLKRQCDRTLGGHAPRREGPAARPAVRALPAGRVSALSVLLSEWVWGSALCRRAGRLTAQNGDFLAGQPREVNQAVRPRGRATCKSCRRACQISASSRGGGRGGGGERERRGGPR